MKCRLHLAALAAGMVMLGYGAQAQTPGDVPATHWARAAVTEVIARGVMDAPSGKFNGDRKVTRQELIPILAKLARSLEKGEWTKATGSIKDQKPTGDWRSKPVTRYELAAVIYRVAEHVTKGLPKASKTVYGKSEALPPAPSLASVARTNPAYEPLAYLVKNRMVWPKSVLLHPSADPVTGQQVSTAISQVVIGLDDRLTDEPEQREDIAPPPGHKH